MFGISFWELIIILIITIIVVGPDRLPDLAKALGRGIGEFRRATEELKRTVNEDDELREIKTSLTQAKEEMVGLVRSQTQGLNIENIAKSLANGQLFNQPPVELKAPTDLDKPTEHLPSSQDNLSSPTTAASEPSIGPDSGSDQPRPASQGPEPPK